MDYFERCLFSFFMRTLTTSNVDRAACHGMPVADCIHSTSVGVVVSERNIDAVTFHHERYSVTEVSRELRLEATEWGSSQQKGYLRIVMMSCFQC